MSIRKYCAIAALAILASCTSDLKNKATDSAVPAPKYQAISPVNDRDTSNLTKAVNYTILRHPTDGMGVFDFMYIVYVPRKIDHAEAQYIFNEIIKKYPSNKIAIDIWYNKSAFYKELHAYHMEDIATSTSMLKQAAKNREKITTLYDRYNIATYTNNGQDISVMYPEDKGD